MAFDLLRGLSEANQVLQAEPRPCVHEVAMCSAKISFKETSFNPTSQKPHS